jgi:hypothetical protein
LDVIKLVSDGWPEGRESVAKLARKTSAIEIAPRDRRRRLSRSDMGDALDIHAVYRGQLDIAWIKARRQWSYGPQRVDILANMLCSGCDDSSVLQWRGAAAIALADKFEHAGYMVRIIVGFGGHTGPDRERISCRITVKGYDSPMNVSTAASVTLPGFFRAIGHGWNGGHVRARTYSAGMSVGQCDVESGEIMLSHEIYDERTAVQFIADQIAAVEAPQAA